MERTVLAATVIGLIAAFISSPSTGVLVGLGIGVVLRRPRARIGLGLVAAACVFGVGAYVTLRQWTFPSAANGGWPTGFGTAAGLAWAGVMFLGADIAAEILLRWKVIRSRSPDEPQATSPVDAVEAADAGVSGRTGTIADDRNP